ncbi:MAG TPA: sigma 54-interacting transcriptional regulator, partial [Blastocatellia bacterium]|nr:sigma 54-interacting transcriptional regulator [Blastocatellia bacterium]
QLAIDHLKKGGRKDQLALAYNNLAANLRDAGEWEAAIESVNKGIEIAQSFTEPSYEATARITLAEILCARGKFLEAEENLERSLKLVEGSVDKWAESNALRILAGVYKGLGRFEEALKTLRKALGLATSIGDLHGVTFAHIELACLHFLQGGHDQAREYLELAQGRLKEEKSLFLSGLIQRLSGQLEAASGRFAEAKQHVAQSISIFTTIKVPYEIARSHFEMGSLLNMARDAKGSEINLLQAKEIFQKVGADSDLEMTVKLLAAIAMGEDRILSPARVTPANDVLLMQRLIEASASRELLLQELASVVYEYFPASAVMICLEEEDRLVRALVTKGLSMEGADRIIQGIMPPILSPARREDGSYIACIGNGFNSSVLLYISASEQLDLNRLQPLLKQAELGLETCSLRNSARSSPSKDFEHRVQTIIPGFICCSQQMFGVIEKIQKIRTSDVTVLITGESGTGKELVARAIHQESARARAIFLPFNCTATPKEIIDSQLFGHRRGAFTGATANYPGIIKAADGGTLFLDEIGDLALEVQPKLMRFLQESEIQPLGETKPLRVDVRVLAATNSDLERAVEDGRFREDLFHRLNIIRIHVSPLRDRREEVPVLASHFLDHFSSRSGKQGISMTQEAMEALTEYDWPGNVRQLRNEIERVVAYASEPARISADDLSPEVAHPRKPSGSTRLRSQTERAGGGREYGSSNGGYENRRESSSTNGGGRMRLKEATARLERQLIEEALVRNRNNLSRTAIDLGLSRRGLRLKLAQLGVQRDDAL